MANLPNEERGYSIPDVLVSTDWVAINGSREDVRLVESNEDPLVYPSGHIGGAIEIDWVRDLNDPLRRDYLQRAEFEALMRRAGITRDTTVVFYGDRNNWWATYAAWVFHLFGHPKIAVMDGGRRKWQGEGRPLVRDVPRPAPTDYIAPERLDAPHRVFRDEVLRHVEAGRPLIDVRSPGEFDGSRLHMEEYPNEGAMRGGHIPGAKNVPWARAIDPEDGTFLAAETLRGIYTDGAGVRPQDDVVAYCRIGERSSVTWFVLKYLLGFANVRNYDGSWTEWGNLVDVPIER
jgi:thiosulfate/3-mercaptopyruvate sulfurtransferase